MIESLIDSYKSAAPGLKERKSQDQPAQPAQIRPVIIADPEPSSKSIAELTREYVSDFKTCVRSEWLMKNQWAESRFADFNLFVDGFGSLSASRAHMRISSVPPTLFEYVC